MTKDPNIPTVKLTKLVPDRCNFEDGGFSDFVDDFMQRYMPGFALGLLDISSEDALDRWQIEPEDRYVATKLEVTVYTCTECGDEYLEGEAEKMEYTCCPLEHLAASADTEFKESEEYEPMQKELRSAWALKDTGYMLAEYSASDGDWSFELPGHLTIHGWTDEENATLAAREKNWENMRENSYGFPWANTWCFQPEDFIESQVLKDAGFTVATYCGGGGNWRNDNSYRLCGIDGGGYNFKGHHFAMLVALVHEQKNWPVETTRGRVYIEVE